MIYDSIFVLKISYLLEPACYEDLKIELCRSDKDSIGEQKKVTKCHVFREVGE